MPWGLATAAVGAYGASQNASAASADSDTSNMLNLYGGMINQANLQFSRDQVAPFVFNGQQAAIQERDLLGVNGPGVQAAAIESLRNSPQFQSMLREGENSILANASATGGLRGGNTQAALAKFSPSLLAATINDRFGQLRGIASAGQNAALGQGNLSAAASQNQAAIINNMTQANSAATRAGIYANNQMTDSIAGGVGALAGMFSGGSGGGGITSVSPTTSFGTGYVPNVFSGAGGSLF